MDIKNNIKEIKKNIEKALERTERSLEDITIVAVSKNVDSSKVIEANKEGLVNFGENRVQEFLKKYEELDLELDWHMIGHLQRNKVKYIYDKVKLIHSVDSIRLARRINKYAAKNSKPIDVLLEVNVAEDDSKFGFKTEELKDAVSKISEFEHINIKGLMTVAPYYDNAEDVRPIFKKLKLIFDNLSKLEYNNVSMQYLSMGMSNDYEIAVQEGANIVRIGTDIFGERKY
jgi:pyridoxal phosphate enzyme (YggS family)